MACPVKSEPILVTPGRSRWPIGVGFLALLALTWSTVSFAQNLLLGPVARRVKAKIELDPRLPTGPVRHRALALPVSKPKACSFREPVCVAFDKTTESEAPRALEALERAYRRLVYGAGLPSPLTRDQALLWVLEAGTHPLSSELVMELGVPFEQAGLVCRSGVTSFAAESASDKATRLGSSTRPGATSTNQPTGATSTNQPTGATSTNQPIGATSTNQPTGATSTNQPTGATPTSIESASRLNDGFERDAWLCVGEAVAARLDAAEGSNARRAYAEALMLRFGDSSVLWDDSTRSSAVRGLAISHRSPLGHGEKVDIDALLRYGERPSDEPRFRGAESERRKRHSAANRGDGRGDSAANRGDGRGDSAANRGDGRGDSAAGERKMFRHETSETISTAVFFDFLENGLGSATPGALLTGLLALSAQPRKPETTRFVNEPDWLDALRESTGDNQVEFARTINAFTVARAELGKFEGPLGGDAWLGQLSPLVEDWVLPVSSLPRRVAARRPVEPLGFIAVRVDVDVIASNLTLAMRVEWEEPAPFTWTLVKIDAEGKELGRLDFAYEPHVTFAEKHVTALEGTKTLLVLGTNLGGIDATHLLDPDRAPFEPHGCTVYVVRM